MEQNDKTKMLFVYASVLLLSGVILLAVSIYVYNTNTCNSESCGKLTNCKTEKCDNSTCTTCWDEENRECILFTEECEYNKTLFVVTFIFGIVCACIGIAFCASLTKRERDSLVQRSGYESLPETHTI